MLYVLPDGTPVRIRPIAPDDKEEKIARPRQIYTGYRERDYVPVGESS